MSHRMRAPGRFVVALALTASCGGGGTKAPAAPDEASDCEPGRCLEDISRLVEEHRPEARACYDAAQKRRPELQGRLVVNFEIDKTGSVVDASQSEQSDQIEDPEMVDCVTAVIMRIPFAASGQGKSTRAFHRFEFTPR